MPPEETKIKETPKVETPTEVQPIESVSQEIETKIETPPEVIPEIEEKPETIPEVEIQPKQETSAELPTEEITLPEPNKTKITDESIGVIPVFKDHTGENLFLVVLHKAGHWAFPKGHQEIGESTLDTAKRELYEETGIKDVTFGDEKEFSEQYSFEKESEIHNKNVKYFVGFVSNKETTTPEEFKNEIEEIKWLNYTEASKTLTFEEARNLLDEVKQYLEKNVQEENPVVEPTPAPPQPQPKTPPKPEIRTVEKIVYKTDPNFVQKLLEKARVRIQERKRKKLDKIMTLFETKSQITNEDVQKLFRTTKRTIRRYFDQLEKEQKIIQVGNVGRGVVYIKKP